MPVMEWRGQKLRFGESAELTLGQAKVIKRFTGLRLMAFQRALQEMQEAEDIDPELVQAFLWLILDQNGQKMDISALDDVPLEEFATAMLAVQADEVPSAVDPTQAPAESDQEPQES